MICNYFGECGACVVYENGYEAQLESKLELNKQRFKELYNGDFFVAHSPQEHYRSRSEFRIWHTDDSISYAMNHQDKKTTLLIDNCPQVNLFISALMPKLLEKIKEEQIEFKLFGADFLSSSTGEIVVSLLYHRKLDQEWEHKARLIANDLNINIIGRSRKQKIVIGNDFVIEQLQINGKLYRSKHIENSFTQPNAKINEKMIEWAVSGLDQDNSDLLELYCGAGNFTIPFANSFKKVLATEISKSSIRAAQENMRLNNVENIEFVRMSVEEFVQALDKVRDFRRMKEIDIESYDFSTVFVDPPRAGMDQYSCNFIARYENIIYISCNPETLYRDLKILSLTHKVDDMAVFDQFPYTHHLEMGVKLSKKGTH